MRIRDARAEDLNYILGTWTNSHLSKYSGRNRANARKAFQAFIRDLMISEPVIKVYASGDNYAVLHSWACASPGIALHYVYTPRELREEGLGRQVIEEAFGGYPAQIPVTHKWPFESKRFVFQPFRRVA